MVCKDSVNSLAVFFLGSTSEGGKKGDLYQLRGWQKCWKENKVWNLATVDTTEKKTWSQILRIYQNIGLKYCLEKLVIFHTYN